MVAPTANPASEALPTAPRDLFGGAMVAAIPTGFDDISRIRDVPDNQEVFSHAPTDRSLLIELVETPARRDEREQLPAAFHIDALASDSGAVASDTHAATALPQTVAPLLAADEPALSVSVASATHAVAKFRDAAALASRVAVTLAVVRLPRANTDVLVVFNDPVALHPAGASARSGAAVAQSVPVAEPTVRACLAAMAIRDWSFLV